MKSCVRVKHYWAALGVLCSLVMSGTSYSTETTTQIDTATEKERSGDFSAEEFPLPFASEHAPWGTQRDGTCIQANCDILPPSCGPGFYRRLPRAPENEVSWAQGYREAMAGEHILTGINVLTSINDPTGYMDPNNPKRMGCNAFRGDSQTPADQHKLTCCLAGFKKGMKKLYAKMQRRLINPGSEPPRPPLDPREEVCRKEFTYGREQARTYCNSRRVDSQYRQCPCVDQFVRYLGCFSIGFYLQASECSDQVQTILRNGGISNLRLPPLPETPAASSEGKTPSAPAEAGSASGGTTP